MIFPGQLVATESLLECCRKQDLKLKLIHAAETGVTKLVYVIALGNSMGSREICDKYHECCIGNGKKFTRCSQVKLPISNTDNKSGIYSKFSLLYPCYSILIPYLYVNVQIALLKHMLH